MVKVDTVKLATGADLPLFGLGTWLSTDHEALTEALKTALDIGYPLVDTAYVYGNEVAIGKVLHEYFTAGKLKREDIFITTKLPFTAHAPEQVEAVVAKQLKDLQIDYIDLYLIHVPCPCKGQPGSLPDTCKSVIENGHVVPEAVDHTETWKVLEKLHKNGTLRAIGVSNFNEEQIQRIIDQATVKPHNLQVEAHLYWPQNELFEFCKKNNITFTSYGTLGSPGRHAFRPDGNWPEGDPMKDPAVVELAKKYQKTPAQILLRQMMQRGIAVIPKSTKPERVRENFNIFDFKLTDDEMYQLENLETRTRLFVFDFFAEHPMYPFKDVDTSKLKEVKLVEF